ncbi:MAG: ABC transporter substrate-binding protein, partial [Ferruginibacter sp.]
KTEIYLRILVLGMLLSSINLVACKPKKNTTAKIFHYNESSGIASLDPAFAKSQSVMWGVHQLFSTLVEVDQQMQLKPLIAKGWEISEDKLFITFHLRNDIFFHDDAAFLNGKGRNVTAEDVVYSFSRILDKNTASPGAWIFNNRVDSIRPFIALNDSVFQLRLAMPFQPIFGILSMQYCSIVAKEVVEKYGNDLRRHPVGTGPFVFVAWEEGQSLVLKRNNHYFEKDSFGYALPYVDGIKVSFYDSKATEFLEFRQKRLDFINDIEASFKDEVLTKTGNLKKQWNGKITMLKHPYLNIEYLGILSDSLNPFIKNSALRLRQIRQAINYGINRQKMMLYLRNSIGTAAESGFIPPGLPSFNAQKVIGYHYDPELAKKLVVESGYSTNPRPITLLTIPQCANLASYIANELKQIGLQVQVEAMQKSLLLEQTSKSQAAFFRGSWIADYPDAENYLSVFYSKNPAPPNYTRYNNKTFDEMYESALKEVNDSARYVLYQQMDKIIIEDAPVVPLWYDMVIHFVQPTVKNFYPNSLNMLELRKVKIE